MKITSIIKFFFIIIGNLAIAQYLSNMQDFIFVLFLQIAILNIFTLLKIKLLPEEKQLEQGEFKSRTNASIFEAILPIFQIYRNRYANSTVKSAATLGLFPFMIGALLTFVVGLVFIPMIIFAYANGAPPNSPIMLATAPLWLFTLYEIIFFVLFLINKKEENAEKVIRRQKNFTIPFTIALAILFVIYSSAKPLASFIGPGEVIVLIILLRIVTDVYSLVKEGEQK